MAEPRENGICWYTGGKDEVATATFTQGRYITKMKKLKERYPDEVEIDDQPDGSLYCRFPAK